MRGSHMALTMPSVSVGIIPAHAGLTRISSTSSRLSRDHPRACGAHASYVDPLTRARGSSPRMRGSQGIGGDDGRAEGIIPAHAGLTEVSCSNWRRGRDHPRACGAHARSSMRSSHRRGSSPRMRGSPLLQIGSQGRKGIIPAHAGLTSLRTSLAKRPGDHPRACGAHTARSMARRAIWGSSPRMRGSPYVVLLHDLVPGIIPAHAGLTSSLPLQRQAVSDHPRACGAHRASQLWTARSSGSSPRMRGSRRPLSVYYHSCGIIPAHAGLT